MKKFSQRGVLLFGVMLAVCVLVPSLASAASWSPVGTHRQLFSPNLSFTATVPVLGQSGSLCAASEFTGDVATSNTIEITNAVFTRCMGTIGAVNCTSTPTGANFPWTATATSTTDVQIHGVDVTVVFENTPGNATACPNPGTIRVTGTLTGGSWNPTSNEVTLEHELGLTAHVLGTGLNGVATVDGTIRDTSGSLRMFM
jgi:hypothetical protein